jgi:hypothetical protein
VKQFIVLTAVLPILMLFVMQISYEQKTNHAISIVHDVIYVAKEQAKEEGSFTWEIQERLKRNINNRLGIPLDDIVIICRQEQDILFYRVEVPMKDIVAGSKFLGIADRDNQYVYVIDSFTKARPIWEPEPDPEPESETGLGPDPNPKPDPEPDVED